MTIYLHIYRDSKSDMRDKDDYKIKDFFYTSSGNQCKFLRLYSNLDIMDKIARSPKCPRFTECFFLFLLYSRQKNVRVFSSRRQSDTIVLSSHCESQPDNLADTIRPHKLSIANRRHRLWQTFHPPS